MIIDFFRRLFAQRDEERFKQWTHFLSRVDDSSHSYLCEIISIKQYARTGTKAYVKCHRGDLDERQAVWLPKLSPSRGDFVLGSGSIGYGKHHKEAVFYFNDVQEVMKSKFYKGFLAHKKRQANNT